MDAVAEITADKDDIIEADSNESDLAANQTVLAGDAKMFDGDDSSYVWDSKGTEYIVDLGSVQTIEKWELVNYWGGYYGMSSFTLSASNDNQNYTEVLSMSGLSGSVESGTFDSSVTGRYFKLTMNDTLSYGGVVCEFKLIGYAKVVYSAGITYDGQKPVLYPTFPDTVYYEELSDETVDPASLVSFETIRGTSAAELKDADFLAEGYDVEAQTGTIAHMTLVNGDPDTVISLAQDATYTVTYTDFNEANPNGELKGTVVVKVGEQKPEVDKSALEALVETAEAIDTEKFTEETVKVLKEALADAKAVLADEDATQAEIDAAYAALEAALNGLAEKGETPVTPPVDTGDYTNMALPIILVVLVLAAAAGCIVFVVRRRRASK